MTTTGGRFPWGHSGARGLAGSQSLRVAGQSGGEGAALRLGLGLLLLPLGASRGPRRRGGPTRRAGGRRRRRSRARAGREAQGAEWTARDGGACGSSSERHSWQRRAAFPAAGAGSPGRRASPQGDGNRGGGRGRVLPFWREIPSLQNWRGLSAPSANAFLPPPPPHSGSASRGGPLFSSPSPHRVGRSVGLVFGL